MPKIHFECFTGRDISSHSLTKNQKKNLLLITKESINNSIKYADCREIILKITSEKTKTQTRNKR